LTNNSESNRLDLDPDAPCLDTRGVCARVGIKMSTLKEHLARATGPRGYRLPGGSSRWRFTRRDVDEWIKGHEHPPPSKKVERLARLQAGVERVTEKRAQPQAKVSEDVTA
jgi:predicted DNA-binding transcriptional regulator AlpA